MRVNLFGRVWRLIWVSKKKLGRNLGDCDSPDAPKKVIRIRDGLEPQDELRVLIHEFLHGCAWWAAEEWVDRASTDIAASLWKLGWRKNEGTK